MVHFRCSKKGHELKIAEQVVEQSSAIIGDAREGKEGIHANHMTMTKFASATDSEYKKVADVIWRFVRDATAAGSAPMTSNDRE